MGNRNRVFTQSPLMKYSTSGFRSQYFSQHWPGFFTTTWTIPKRDSSSLSLFPRTRLVVSGIFNSSFSPIAHPSGLARFRRNSEWISNLLFHLSIPICEYVKTNIKNLQRQSSLSIWLNRESESSEFSTVKDPRILTLEESKF